MGVDVDVKKPSVACQILNFDVANNYSVMYITCCLNFDVI